MKKNLIVGLLAIAGLFAVSCQQDLSLEGTTIGESIVTFNVGTPQIVLNPIAMVLQQLNYSMQCMQKMEPILKL